MVINTSTKCWLHFFLVCVCVCRGGADYVRHLHFLQFKSDWLSEVRDWATVAFKLPSD